MSRNRNVAAHALTALSTYNYFKVLQNIFMEPATGKLGVMCVGLGAVTTTFMTGVLMTRKGLAKPVGSMTQYDKIRVGLGGRSINKK